MLKIQFLTSRKTDYQGFRHFMAWAVVLRVLCPITLSLLALCTGRDLFRTHEDGGGLSAWLPKAT